MALRSMTGFARSDGSDGGLRWQWELRSVNGRGLDVRLRLPSGYEGIEPRLRTVAQQRLSRGNLSATLTVDHDDEAAAVRVNKQALTTIMAEVERLGARGGFDRPRPEGVLALRGVIEIAEPLLDERAKAARDGVLLDGFDRAVTDLIAARSSEGERLASVLLAQLQDIERLTAALAASPARTPESIRQRLAEQVRRLLEATSQLDSARLHQEAALLATRADIEEEIKRLAAHVAAARELIAGAEPSGRKLDFLSQEFNREANTICSKAYDVEMTRLGLELKAVIDQFREQVQNIE